MLLPYRKKMVMVINTYSRYKKEGDGLPITKKTVSSSLLGDGPGGLEGRETFCFGPRKLPTVSNFSLNQEKSYRGGKRLLDNPECTNYIF